MFRYSLVFLVALATAGSAAASWADAMFEELQRDFGSVPRGPMLTHPFRLTNKTAQPVHIAGVRVSCGCVNAQALQNDLPPGQSTAILAQMDTRRFSGVKSVTIYVQFDQPQWEEVHLVVHANSRDDVTLTPDSLTFGRVKRGTAPSSSVSISLLGDGQWEVVGVRSESNYVQPSLKQVRRENGEVVYQLTAKIRPDVPVGKWFTDLWLRTNNATTPRIRVPLTVEVEPALSVTPASAALGQVKMGETAERKIIVRGSGPFRITGIKGADDVLSVSDASPDSKPVHVLTVKLKAEKPGELNWNVKVLTDLKDEGEISFTAKANVVP